MVKSGHFEALIGGKSFIGFKQILNFFNVFSEASLQTLRQMVANKKSEFIAMEAVIPFLEVTTNQKYLVQRLRGCLISINNDKLIVIL